MIETEINDLIARMTDLGFEYARDTEKGVVFRTVNGGNGVLTLGDWDAVEAFVDGQDREMERTYARRDA